MANEIKKAVNDVANKIGISTTTEEESTPMITNIEEEVPERTVAEAIENAKAEKKKAAEDASASKTSTSETKPTDDAANVKKKVALSVIAPDEFIHMDEISYVAAKSLEQTINTMFRSVFIDFQGATVVLNGTTNNPQVSDIPLYAIDNSGNEQYPVVLNLRFGYMSDQQIEAVAASGDLDDKYIALSRKGKFTSGAMEIINKFNNMSNHSLTGDIALTKTAKEFLEPFMYKRPGEIKVDWKTFSSIKATTGQSNNYTQFGANVGIVVCDVCLDINAIISAIYSGTIDSEIFKKDTKKWSYKTHYHTTSTSYGIVLQIQRRDREVARIYNDLFLPVYGAAIQPNPNPYPQAPTAPQFRPIV